MKLNLGAAYQSFLSRIATDIENEAYYGEPHEASEPVFWMFFSIVLIISLVSIYVVAPVLRLLKGR